MRVLQWRFFNHDLDQRTKNLNLQCDHNHAHVCAPVCPACGCVFRAQIIELRTRAGAAEGAPESDAPRAPQHGVVGNENRRTWGPSGVPWPVASDNCNEEGMGTGAGGAAPATAQPPAMWFDELASLPLPSRELVDEQPGVAKTEADQDGMPASSGGDDSCATGEEAGQHGADGADAARCVAAVGRPIAICIVCAQGCATMRFFCVIFFFLAGLLPSQ